ncbi:MAG: substrate-binding domain-containing protein [Verrucomicrobiales bacterium]
MPPAVRPSIPADRLSKFTILGLCTDETDKSRAKQNAESTLLKHVKTWTRWSGCIYNAPQMPGVLAKDAGKAGKVKIFSFDEDEATLQGIKDGLIEGTIVQDPYEFGYQSMKYLKMIADGKRARSSCRTTNRSTSTARPRRMSIRSGRSWKERRAAGEEAANQPTPENGPRFAFVINTPDPFWSYAALAARKPSKTSASSASSKRERRLGHRAKPHFGKHPPARRLPRRRGSPRLNPPTRQTSSISRRTPCRSSATTWTRPSKRRFYLGTNNVGAYRMLGKLIKKRMPEGGKIMVFVGKIDVLNAQQRRDGLIEELSKP